MFGGDTGKQGNRNAGGGETLRRERRLKGEKEGDGWKVAREEIWSLKNQRSATWYTGERTSSLKGRKR